MSSDDDIADVPWLASDRWTPIAFRPRLGLGPVTLRWVPIEGAPIDENTARKLQVVGKIFMANRHTREFVELVVRPAPSLEEASRVGRPIDNDRGPSP